MRAGRRLRRLEDSLSPLDTVLGWLSTAHRYATAEECALAMIALEASTGPLDPIAQQVETAVRVRLAGHERPRVDRAVLHAVGDAAFLYYLALRVDEAAGRLATLAGLKALLVQTRLSEAHEELPAAGANELAEAETNEIPIRLAWQTWAPVAAELVREVRVEDEAHRAIERDLYAEHSLLFPATAEAWQELLEAIHVLERWPAPDWLASSRRGASSNHAPIRVDRDAAWEARVAARVAELVDDARISAFDYLGRPDDARAVAMARLRARARS